MEATYEIPETDNYEQCAYCGAGVFEQEQDAPDARDDAAWAAISLDHREDCEWVTTRAHRLLEV